VITEVRGYVLGLMDIQIKYYIDIVKVRYEGIHTNYYIDVVNVRYEGIQIEGYIS
jgi:hypothetical protein